MKIKLFITLILLFVLLSPIYKICAQTIPPVPGNAGDPAKPVTLKNPLTGDSKDTDINKLIGQIINAVLGIVGSLALVMFIYGGFTWMLAAGNNEKVQKGKDIIIWAAVGLVVIFSAYALVKFVFSGLGVT
jgi:hypothetical protein